MPMISGTNITLSQVVSFRSCIITAALLGFGVDGMVYCCLDKANHYESLVASMHMPG